MEVGRAEGWRWGGLRSGGGENWGEFKMSFNSSGSTSSLHTAALQLSTVLIGNIAVARMICGSCLHTSLFRPLQQHTIQCPMGPVPRIVTRSHDHRVPPRLAPLSVCCDVIGRVIWNFWTLLCPSVSYYIIGGLVFSPMTTGLLFAATDDFTEEGLPSSLHSTKPLGHSITLLFSLLFTLPSPSPPLYSLPLPVPFPLPSPFSSPSAAWQASRNPKQHPDEELVILLSVLAHPINNGYTINKLPQ